MRIALITPWVVAPPIIGGLQIRFYQLQCVLARIAAPAELLLWDLREAGPVDLAHLPDTSPARAELAAFPALPGVAGFAREAGLFALHAWPWYVAPSLSLKQQQARILAWIEAQRPECAVVVHPYTSELIPALRRRGVRVFVDCHNVESDLALRLARLATTRRERLQALLRARVFRRRERLYFPLAQEIWLPSEVDIKRQRAISTERARFRCVPNALDLAQYMPERAEATHDLVYPAEFGYPPNVVAARLLAQHILPEVRRSVPDARLVLVGRDRFGLVGALRRDPEVVVTGTVPEVQPYLQRAAVMPVPLLQASGTRYKILEALALEVPVVTTPLGCEGLEVRDGEHLLVRDIAQFAPAIIELLRAPAAGRELARNGRRLVEERYSWRVVEEILREALMEA